MSSVFIEVRFGSAIKIVIFQVRERDVLFERYFNEKKAFRKSICLGPSDRRLADLELFCVCWKLHYYYINERKRTISENAILQSQCNLRY
jgi:hypothetical protein